MSRSSGSSSQACIATSIALAEQLVHTLFPENNANAPRSRPDSPSLLLLLSAAAKSLKAQVTKLSLLTVTTPYTPSAVATCLRPITESILPSLATAALLCNADLYTSSFVTEVRSVCRLALSELLLLLKCVRTRDGDGSPKKELSTSHKNEITGQAGRVWEKCDELVRLAEGGLPGFVVRKSKQWLELMKDAVKELQAWDPEEEVDPDDLFGDAVSDDEIPEKDEHAGDRPSNDRATISAGVKEQVLKVLTRIPQSVHVVIKQRLEKLDATSKDTLPPNLRAGLEMAVTKIRSVSESIDESAEAMYMGDPELCLKKAGEARAITIEIIGAFTRPPFRPTERIEETQEDKYIARAELWIQQVAPKYGLDTS